MWQFVEEVEAEVPPDQVTGSGAEALAALEVVEVVEAAIESHTNGDAPIGISGRQVHVEAN